MDAKTLLFFLFATIAALASLRVVTAKNPVHAVLFLVLVFFNVAALWLLLAAEFLAMALIMVYVGAVMVLFLFVVMMLDINVAELRARFWRYLPLGALVGVLMVTEMAVALSGRYFALEALPTPTIPANISNTRALGRLLYTDYAYPLEIASVVLLVGIVAAVMLTLRQRTDKKPYDPQRQLAVRAQDRLRIVNMEAERPAQDLASSAAAAIPAAAQTKGAA